MRRTHRFQALLAFILVAIASPAFAQLSPSAEWAVHAANQYQVFPNLTYLTASNFEAKLDIYKRRDTTGPQPTVIFDVIEGPHRANAAMQWFGSLPNREEIAHRVSPLTYVRSGLPPILTIHGDADTTVPYQHAVRLHEALAKAEVTNQLITIPGGKHGNFTPAERTKIFSTIREFLAKNGLGGK